MDQQLTTQAPTATPADTSQLVNFDQARVALEKAYRIDEIKEIRDQAEAAKAYAKQARLSLDMQLQIAEIKLRAERRAGEILRDMEKATGARAPGVGRRGGAKRPREAQETRSHDATALSDLGITKSDSSRWQQIAAMPKREFEAHLCEQRANGKPATTAGVLRAAKPATPKEPPKFPLSDGVIKRLKELVGFTAFVRTETGKRTFDQLMSDPEWEPAESQFAIESLGGLARDLTAMHKEAEAHERKG